MRNSLKKSAKSEIGSLRADSTVSEEEQKGEESSL